MTKKDIITAAIALTSLFGCSEKSTSADQTVYLNPDSTLIIYYSQTGITRNLAEEIKKHLCCEMVEIEAVDPYDGDYNATIARWSSELKDGVKVAIKPLDVNLSDYNTIFLGFPIWGGTYASPVASFLDDVNLEGKTVVTFATFGSGGLSTATADVAAAQPAANVVRGYGVRKARFANAAEELADRLAEMKFIEGDYIEKPEWSEPREVGSAEKNIFDEACGSYIYPLGSPVCVRWRQPEGCPEEFLFLTTLERSEGDTLERMVTVIVPKDGKPEFTSAEAL